MGVDRVKSRGSCLFDRMTYIADHPPHNPRRQGLRSKPIGFTAISVRGFKSFAEETSVQLGMLTILAGTNSSGKSSIMQPLLLMKQTLETAYDPGALLLDGPNISFTLAEQFLAKSSTTDQAFTVRFSTNNGLTSQSVFNWSSDSGINISEQSQTSTPRQDALLIRPSMVSGEIREIVKNWHPLFGVGTDEENPLAVGRDRCFLECIEMGTGAKYTLFNSSFIRVISAIIHVKGLRGTPERTYNTASVGGSVFIGQFEKYVASLIDRFQKEDPEKLIKLQQALQKLGLTDIIQAQRLNDTQIELRVGRVLGQADPTDTVNIADVGFGVSQVLPVIVALLVAEPEQMVYVEQPEIHLHPRAQVALSEIFADAANRGVRVVVETHSELFLMGIQALVAEDKLDPGAVKLHWFTRQPDGSSRVTSADLDETGAFGDWPEDFGSTTLGMANRYLSAAETKIWQTSNGH
jgi:AAA domain, putative AbiEii toxin, Type IV TA system/AAA ATPase domain